MTQPADDSELRNSLQQSVAKTARIKERRRQTRLRVFDRDVAYEKAKDAFQPVAETLHRVFDNSGLLVSNGLGKPVPISSTIGETKAVIKNGTRRLCIKATPKGKIIVSSRHALPFRVARSVGLVGGYPVAFLTCSEKKWTQSCIGWTRSWPSSASTAAVNDFVSQAGTFVQNSRSL